MVNVLNDIIKEGKYSITDTCKILGIHRNSLLNYQKRGLIKPSFHKTGHKFFYGSEITRFFNSIF